ncbi:TonB-dependent receptor [Halosquirtibacter laminarini]|uniref:TonB-dependent receptor n=1 Tax=Halosquirtibacter laminarini TaxID=3374600 RepID=A0AC61NHX1_9BACT|nr:TonB-dependent receptor [Prolixibacteraceae bacterium]
MKSINSLRSSALVFKRWNGHAYSAFSTIKRVVHIAALMSTYIALVPSLDANAQEVVEKIPEEEDTLVHEVDEITVSAKRVPVLLSDVNRSVTVIDRKEIELAPVQSVQDLIEYAMGVDFRQRGGMGVQTDMSIRGGTSEQVAVLINGMCINDPQTGHNTLNIPIPMDAIKRIEILNGAASVNYGVNAFTGAINIITDSEDTSSIKTRVDGGQFGYFNGGLSASFASRKWTNFVSAGYKHSDGYIDNTDFDITNYYIASKYHTRKRELRFQAGYVDNAYGANSFYTPKYPDQYEQIKTFFSSIEMKDYGRMHLSPSVYYRRGVDHFKLYRDRSVAPSWYITDNYHQTDVLGVNLDSWFHSPVGKIAVGFSYRYEGIMSNVLGEIKESAKEIKGVTEAMYDKGHQRSNYSLFVSDDFTLGNLDVSLSAMAVKNSDLDESVFFAPGVTLGYGITDELRWVASANRALRLPTYTDLYYNSPNIKGNINLKPEKGTTYETGLKYYGSSVQAKINVFYRKTENMIDWLAPVGNEDPVYVAENISNLNTYGVEGDIHIPFSNCFLKKISLNYAFLNQNLEENDHYDSAYLFDYLKAKVDLGVTHTIYGPIVANWKVTYQSRNGSYTAYNAQMKPYTEDYDPFVVANVRVSYIHKAMNIYGEVANLFDKSYVDIGSVEQPGRWVRLGISYKLNL